MDDIETRDYVIVGGGVAGMVLAISLATREPDLSIALLELGREPSADSLDYLASLRDKYDNARAINVATVPQLQADMTQAIYRQAIMLGGQSVFDDALWWRGGAIEWDEWANDRLDNTVFGYHKMVPEWTRLETYSGRLDRSLTGQRGFNGPVLVTQPSSHSSLDNIWAEAFRRAATKTLKLPEVIDYNTEKHHGVADAQLNVQLGPPFNLNRQSMVNAFISLEDLLWDQTQTVCTPGTPNLPNLTIVCGALCDRVLFRRRNGKDRHGPQKTQDDKDDEDERWLDENQWLNSDANVQRILTRRRLRRVLDKAKQRPPEPVQPVTKGTTGQYDFAYLDPYLAPPTTGKNTNRAEPVGLPQARGVLYSVDGISKIMMARKGVVLCASTYGDVPIMERSGFVPSLERARELGVPAIRVTPRIGQDVSVPVGFVCFGRPRHPRMKKSGKKKKTRTRPQTDRLDDPWGIGSSESFEDVDQEEEKEHVDVDGEETNEREPSWWNSLALAFGPDETRPDRKGLGNGRRRWLFSAFRGLYENGNNRLPSPLFCPLDPVHDISILALNLDPISRGAVEIINRDPFKPPRIDLGLYESEADLRSALAQLRQVHRIFEHMDCEMIWPPPSVLNDEEHAKAFLRSEACFVDQVNGGCRAHQHPDQGVCDGFLRVYGVEGLSICDSSVFGTGTGMGPNLTAVVAALALKFRHLLREHIDVAERNVKCHCCRQVPPMTSQMLPSPTTEHVASGQSRHPNQNFEPPFTGPVAAPSTVSSFFLPLRPPAPPEPQFHHPYRAQGDIRVPQLLVDTFSRQTGHPVSSDLLDSAVRRQVPGRHPASEAWSDAQQVLRSSLADVNVHTPSTNDDGGGTRYRPLVGPDMMMTHISPPRTFPARNTLAGQNICRDSRATLDRRPSESNDDASDSFSMSGIFRSRSHLRQRFESLAAKADDQDNDGDNGGDAQKTRSSGEFIMTA